MEQAHEGRSQSGLPERPQLYGIAAYNNEREGPQGGLSGYVGLLGAVELNGNVDELDAILETLPGRVRNWAASMQSV